MMPKRHIEEDQLDYFRKESLTGMNQAAEMLSKFLKPGFNFQIESEETEIQQNPPLAEVCLKVDGAVNGGMKLLFTAENACRLAGLLLRREPPTDLDGDDVRSTLNEVGNIFASGVLFSFDDRMGIRSMPSPPTFHAVECGSTEESLRGNFCLDDMLSMSARLMCKSPDGLLLEGAVYFMVTLESLEKLAKDGLFSTPGPVVSS